MENKIIMEKMEKNRAVPRRKFAGFKPGKHVVVVGATGTGKTTNTITQMLHNLFPYMEMMIVCGGMADKDNIQNWRRAMLCQAAGLNQRGGDEGSDNRRRSSPESQEITRGGERLGDQEENGMGEEEHQEERMEEGKVHEVDGGKLFAYFQPVNHDKALQMLESADSPYRDKRKVVVFDDPQASNNAMLKRKKEFIIGAKNANASCVVIVHFAFNAPDITQVRDSCNYKVLYNMKEDNFNRLIGKKKDNDLWKRYEHISDPLKRVIIYDHNEEEYWSGIYPYEDFNPAIV